MKTTLRDSTSGQSLRSTDLETPPGSPVKLLMSTLKSEKKRVTAKAQMNKEATHEKEVILFPPLRKNTLISAGT